ncbi:MAG: S41 family peptidase [Halieaceae bacterium]|jgi:carboxyl-terminal processing protease|uniref:S41 family peptidase n=1 Tax=Haliea alexandrii TaxID=2448162 RepID=UPI000F0B5E54|nr:S41 family peptidase [Haliea alexandrii]MCR9185261.1 S41 family peptidase [Halieaceae bacterium]
MHSQFSPLAALRNALLACFLGAPAALAQHTQQNAELPLDELRTFADVFNQIRIGYVEEIDDSTLLEYAIQGMLMNLDPHSAYLTEEAFEDLQSNTSGEFSGLGIEVGMEDGYVKIVAPIDGSPAAEAGLMSGDLILKLDGKQVKGLSLNEAIELMRGPKGSPIELQIGRPGASQPFDITLKRDTIKVASVRERFLEPGYGYIRVAQFQTGTGDDVGAALERLMAKSSLKGLVLDLRNNPGGVLGASVDVAGLFMDGGLVVYTEGRLANSAMRYAADAGDVSNGAPLVVLINGGSASASEIVAGALQDQKRAVIMGTDSFGKGSVQTVMPISESRAVKLTTALYFTPNGRSIQAAGIEPDIIVERAQVTAYDTSNQITEADLTRRLDNVNGETRRSQRPSEGLLGTDNQLYEALTLLKGVNILGLRSAPASAAGDG